MKAESKREHPILFKGPMIRALLAGEKSVTRRTNKMWLKVRKGDRLWCREMWQAIHVSIDPETGWGDDVVWAANIPVDSGDGLWTVAHAADDTPGAQADREERGFPWRPSIHMPRWASRILLEATEDAREELLHDITDEEAVREGVMLWKREMEGEWPRADGLSPGEKHWPNESPRSLFSRLWESIHGMGAWSQHNPELVRLAVRVLEVR